MTFIITLITLIIERFFHWGHLRQWSWFDKYGRLLDRYLGRWSPALGLFLSILPILIIVSLLEGLLSGWGYHIPKIVFGVAVLLYCMGSGNVWAEAYACINELHLDDPKVAVDHAQAAFGIPLPQNSQEFHGALTRALFKAAHERIFAVVFWFVLLGPVGAVLYRVVAICATKQDSKFMPAGMKMQRWLDWLPVRLFTFIYALGGHFTEVFAIWKKDAKRGVAVNDELLTKCGMAALNVQQSEPHLPEDGSAEKSAIELLDRVFVMALVLLAAIVLIALK